MAISRLAFYAKTRIGLYGHFCPFQRFILLQLMLQFNGTIQIALVSFKNIHIWPSYCQNNGIRFSAITQPFSGPIGLKYLQGAQETIIYRLVMRSPSYDTYFSFLIFWATFGGKMNVATTRAPNGLGFQARQKVGPLSGPFGPTTISKSYFRNFQG